MKKITCIVWCLMSTQFFAQQAFQLDSVKVQSWQQDGNSWLNTLKRHFYYDNDGTKDTREYQFVFQEGAFDSITRTFKTYNANNYIVEEHMEAYTMPQWEDSGLIQYGYTGENLLEFKLTSLPLGGDQYLETERLDYSYDNLGNKIEEILQLLNPQTFQLENNDRDLFTYNGTLLIEDISQTWNNTWVNDFKRDYTCNASDFPSTVERRQWLGNDWSGIEELTTFTYNADNLVTIALVEKRVGNNFVNDARVLNSYDSAPNLIQVVTQQWEVDAWNNVGNLIQNYDSDNNIEEQITQIWESDAWLNQMRLLSYWSPTENLSLSFISDETSVKIFPNPTVKILQVTLSQKTSSPIKAILYDVLGKQLKSQEVAIGTASFQIDLEAQTKGVYLLELREQGRKRVYRIIKD